LREKRVDLAEKRRKGQQTERERERETRRTATAMLEKPTDIQ
jgi:hypothetical protein